MRSLPFPVHDADNHLYETQDAFLRHLPDQYKSKIQYVQVNGRTRLAIGGQISEYIPNPTFDVVAAPGAWDVWNRAQNHEGLTLREIQGKAVPSIDAYRNGEARVKLLDQQGIQSTLMFPTLASAIEERMSFDHDLLHAAIHALNAWLLDEWGFDRGGRIYAVPFISLANLDKALGELEWLLKNGARAIGIRPAPVPGYRGTRSPGHPDYDPFWARVAEAKILVCLHSADSGYARFTQMWEGGGESELLPFQSSAFRDVQNIFYRSIEDALTALICHGVFTRHPNVRVASVESGSAWVDPLLKRFTHAYGQMPKSFKEHPVETFRRHIFVSPYYEDNIPKLVEDIGVSQVLFGSDYPHPEGLRDPLDFVDELGPLPVAAQAQIMGGNLRGLIEGRRP